jgi:hypothetical protein
MFSTDIGTLIPFQSQPMQTLDQFLLGAFDKAAPIRIFDTQKETSACLSGQQIVI